METCRRAENMSWMGAKVNAIRMLNVENLGTKRVGILISIYKYKLYHYQYNLCGYLYHIFSYFHLFFWNFGYNQFSIRIALIDQLTLAPTSRSTTCLI